MGRDSEGSWERQRSGRLDPLIINGVSVNGGSPKWLVYKGKSHWNGWFRVPSFQETSKWDYPSLEWLKIARPRLWGWSLVPQKVIITTWVLGSHPQCVMSQWDDITAGFQGRGHGRLEDTRRAELDDLLKISRPKYPGNPRRKIAISVISIAVRGNEWLHKRDKIVPPSSVN